MFFTLSKKIDHRFPFNDQFGDYWFSHDSGWHFSDNTWTKGYYYPHLNHGNFLKLRMLSNSDIVLEHDSTRGFPLWWDNDKRVLTNLLGAGLQLWSDRAIKITNHCLNDYNCFDYSVNLGSKISVDHAVDLICENLVAKAEQLKHEKIPKKMFLTGGVDTATIYSALKYANVEFELIDYEYIKYDCFLNTNFTDITKSHWGYKQIHHWEHPTMLLTGSCGDEYLMRGPSTVALWSAWHDINLVNMLENNMNCYHAEYFLNDKNLSIFKRHWEQRNLIRENYQQLAELSEQIINISCNDFQFWHLGNTITWTPFKDIELLKICMRLDINDLALHFQHATLNRAVIQKLCPTAIDFVSKFKNSKTARTVFNDKPNLT
jgi:hypothetical protein